MPGELEIQVANLFQGLNITFSCITVLRVLRVCASVCESVFLFFYQV